METLAALAILAMVIIGPFELGVKAISYSNVSQNQIIAYYLAQEAMEFVNSRIMTNKLRGLDWLDGFNDCHDYDYCYIDVFNNSIYECLGTCPRLKYDESLAFSYNYNSGNETIFTRNLTINSDNESGDSLAPAKKIKVSVTWTEKTGQKSVILEKNIFNTP